MIVQSDFVMGATKCDNRIAEIFTEVGGKQHVVLFTIVIGRMHVV